MTGGWQGRRREPPRRGRPLWRWPVSIRRIARPDSAVWACRRSLAANGELRQAQTASVRRRPRGRSPVNVTRSYAPWPSAPPTSPDGRAPALPRPRRAGGPQPGRGPHRPGGATALVEGRLVTDLAYAGLGDAAGGRLPDADLVRDTGDPDKAPSESAAAKAGTQGPQGRRARGRRGRGRPRGRRGEPGPGERGGRRREPAGRDGRGDRDGRAGRARGGAAGRAGRRTALALADKTYDRAGHPARRRPARLDDLRR